ncbi:conserved hypothetical protein [Bosea sp. 62]|uniref:DUF1178 family protein n=1 Tax=unclassified Bosea (in: a-proteobacteria) TaxID=2653178 RepID=UPI001257C728|nr:MULTISPECIES: DUF1178 family protein [unclassified Bosea (in: a-proteobacteria)]CAD5249641.1 conserved hypothetical protein [Bosea sp. 46]CAD5250331.1 conserved hypothetical protein [Bosea sp. 21B]CAD5264699.1 conserved hypothetical protein [Bosea sp. 7B]VVT44274.1 conserved hypothetical protein [Bosea sp. EC-HK365B]VXB10485.1 conserved hypothetical protein [Bosea sp. 29B]
MIRYTLTCDNAHEFESWFASSASFDEQANRGFVTCPVCDSAKVERAVMAPAVARTDRGPRPAGAAPEVTAPSSAPAPSPVPATQPAALIGEKEMAFRAMLTALHEHVAANAEPVGKNFAEEALKIHHGESESRAIYGEASAEDAQMLHEEGVEFLPLPRLPEGRN